MSELDAIAAEAQVAVTRGDWPAAADAFERLAAGLDPLPAAVAYNAGVAHRRAGNLAAAIGWLDSALAADPDHLNAAYERAAAWMEDGRLREALAGFEDYLEVEPDDRDAALNRARLLLSLGRWSDAEDAWSAVDAGTGPHPEARLARLTVLAETHRHTALLDEARALYATHHELGAEILRHLTHAGSGTIPLRATVLTSKRQSGTGPGRHV